MRAKLFPIATLILAGLAIGALLGRRWKGDLADSALFAIGLLTFAIVVTPWLLPRVRSMLAEHFVLERREGQWLVRLQSLWRVELIEFNLVLPSARMLRWQVRRETSEPRLLPLRLSTVLSEWALMAAVGTAFALPFLNFDPRQLLTGNEYDVVATLDFVLSNSLQQFGQFPLWNFYLRTGQPLVADPFFHALNPFSTLPVLLWGVVNGFKVTLFWTLLLAALGQWTLSYALGLNRAVRLWSALLYAFNGQFVARFIQGEYDFALGYAWIPFVFAGVVLSLKMRRPRYYALAALAFALVFFSGNVYYAYYTAIILGLGALIAGIRFEGRRVGWNFNGVAPFVVVGLLALGLTAIQALPTLEFWRYIEKMGDPGLQTSQPLGEIAQNYLSSAIERPIAQRFLPPEEYYGYIGWVPLLAALLALGALWQDRRKEIVAWMLLFVFVLTWINVRYTPLAPLFERIPVLYQFRYPSRIMIFGTVAIIALGGIGLTWLMKWIGEVQLERRMVGHIRRTVIALLVVIMLFSVADVFQANRRVLGTRALYEDASQVLEWLHQYDPSPHYVSIPVSSLWHYATASNEERYLDAWYGYAFFAPVDENRNARPVVARPNYQVLSRGERAQSPDSTVVKEFDLHRVYRLNESLPYAFLVTQAALSQIDEGELRRSQVQELQVNQIGANTLLVSALVDDSNAWITVLTSFYPGWRVTVDGLASPLTQVGSFLATPAIAGQHTYIFEFDPPLFKIGFVISLISFIVALWAIFLA